MGHARFIVRGIAPESLGRRGRTGRSDVERWKDGGLTAAEVGISARCPWWRWRLGSKVCRPLRSHAAPERIDTIEITAQHLPANPSQTRHPHLIQQDGNLQQLRQFC